MGPTSLYMNVELWTTIDRILRSGDIDAAASHLEALLRAEKTERFGSLADLHFSNPPQLVLDHVNSFISACRAQFDVESIYLEMNGFDINYDRWYFDSFGYSEYGADPDDLEWLCDWQSPDWAQFTLTGVEQTQDDFRWYMESKIGRTRRMRQRRNLPCFSSWCASSNRSSRL